MSKNISLLLFKDGADLRMESISCKQSPHTLLLGANGFTLLTTSHLILKLMFSFLISKRDFQTRFNLHKSCLKLEHKRTSTTHSEHVWKLKNKNINFNIRWQIVKKVKPFAPNDKVCKLCLQENLST